MIRSELIQLLARDNPSLSAREVETIVSVFFDEITDAMSEGGRAELRGFGVFSTRTRKQRAGRNPRTGSSVEVPDKRVPFFKAGKELRQRMNG